MKSLTSNKVKSERTISIEKNLRQRNSKLIVKKFTNDITNKSKPGLVKNFKRILACSSTRPNNHADKNSWESDETESERAQYVKRNIRRTPTVKKIPRESAKISQCQSSRSSKKSLEADKTNNTRGHSQHASIGS